jgi:hypothetical protein
MSVMSDQDGHRYGRTGPRTWAGSIATGGNTIRWGAIPAESIRMAGNTTPMGRLEGRIDRGRPSL